LPLPDFNFLLKHLGDYPHTSVFFLIEGFGVKNDKHILRKIQRGV